MWIMDNAPRIVATTAIFLALWLVSCNWWAAGKAFIAAVMIENAIVYINAKYTR